MMTICADCRLPIKTKNVQSNGLCGPCTRRAKGEPSVRVTPLERDDLELLLAWRSNPEIYRYFRKQDEPLHWDKHVSWFESRVAERYDFVIHYEGRRVGVINIDQDDIVGIYLGDFSVHGQGIATKTLNWLCDRFEGRTPLFAEIHGNNDTSKRLFRRCGFQQADQDGKWLKYIYDP
jgi:RimJ/RimL family protein N-acetyltransferase